MEWLWYSLFVIASGFCLVLTLFQLPGLWIMVAFAAAYAWGTHSAFLGPIALVLLLLLALAAEGLETFSTAHGARRNGATRTAMILSLFGAVTGGILLTAIPIPIISTLIGVCLGAFVGALLGELIRGRSPQQGIRAGFGAAIGRLFGTVIKLLFGVVMFLIAAIAALPLASSTTPPPPTTPTISTTLTTAPALPQP